MIHKGSRYNDNSTLAKLLIILPFDVYRADSSQTHAEESITASSWVHDKMRAMLGITGLQT